MIKKTIILLVLYVLQFYLTSLQRKEYFAKLNQKSGAGAGWSWVFLAPCSWSRSHMKKKQEPEPEPLGKKIRSRSR
jgi:hypothetical protein